MRKSLLTISNTMLSLVMLLSPVMADSGQKPIKYSPSQAISLEREKKSNELSKLTDGRLENLRAKQVSAATPFLKVSKQIPFGIHQKDGLSRAMADGADLKGNVIYQEDWTNDNAPYGIYSLSTVAPLSIEALALNPALNNVGTYAGDDYFVFEFAQFFGSIISVTWKQFNTSDWSLVNTVNKELALTNILNCVYYDEGDELLYGIAYNSDASGVNFVKVDKSLSAAPQVIAELPVYQVFTLAGDGNGELYCITSEAGDGVTTLSKIDKSTGALTEIGSTGVYAKYIQSMGYDKATQKMYWAACDKNEAAMLYDVDLASGAVTLLGNMPKGEEFASIWSESEAVASDAPAAVSNLAMEFSSAGSLSGVLTFDVPAFSQGGAMLTTLLQAKVIVDGEIVDESTVNAGSVYSNPLTLEEGLHTIKVSVSNEAGDSPQSTIKVYAGFDTPKPVTDLVFAESGNNASVSWAPIAETGVNGGTVDMSAVSYNVYRNPGSVSVATGLTSTSYSESLPSALAVYSYSVEAVAGSHTSALATSNSLMCGDGIEVPYTQEFRGASDLELYTIVDVNGDGKTWGFRTNSMAYSYHASNVANDWAFTPAINMEAGEVYVLSFKMKVQSTSYAENRSEEHTSELQS